MGTKEFIEAFEAGTKDLEAFSVGASPGCSECGLDAGSLDVSGVAWRGHPLRFWSEGSGDLYLYVESLGPVGAVRAGSWEEAWECVIDSIMDDADPADPDTYARSYEPDAPEGELADGCHYRSGSPDVVNGLRSPIAREDINGSRLIGPIRPADEHGAPLETVTVDVPGAYRVELDVDWGDLEGPRACAEEGGFSWSECDICGSSLGGDRYPAHWIYTAPDGRRSIEHERVCVDCLMYAANGDVPESWGEDDDESEEGA